ncbi:MAG: TonB-dependent receptor plug domain-containing protein [Chitinophagales bacterium]|nr:TonB-dependent receptor plug domain-containing protein [Bacteroidota bacterium]
MLKGKVIDQNTKSPLAGATIELKKGKIISTDQEGNFSFDCIETTSLNVSYIGYASTSQVVNCSAKNILIELQPTAESLDVIEITASSNANKSLLEQPTSIVRMETKELKRGVGLFLDDAINTNVPGVIMERRTISAGQQINIRGYGNGMGIRGVNSNFDMQGTKVYLNGIPVTDAEGITALDDIDFNSIGNVEILKGPSGTLYGLAIAGVMNLQTLKASRNSAAISQDLLLGSYGLLRATTQLSIGTENSSLLLNYGHQDYDGFTPHTNSHKDFVNLMGDFYLNKKQSLTTYVGFADSYDQRNGELSTYQYATLDYSGNAAYIKNDAHSAIRTFRAGIGHTYTFNEHFANTTSFFGSGQNIDQSSAGGWTDKIPVNYGLRSTFDIHFPLNENITLSGIVGAELQKMNAQTIGYGMSADSTNLDGYNVITSTKSNQAVISSTSSYFTQWTLHLRKDLSINAGLGISNMSLSLEDRLWANNNNYPNNTKARTYNANYKNLVSPNVGINKTFNNKVSGYASYTVAHKAPVSSNIIIATTGQINKDLKPEQGNQIEIGTKGNLLSNRLFYTLALYQTVFKDKFTTETVQNAENTATLYSYIVNGGSLDNKGLELLLRYDLIADARGFFTQLRPFANFTYADYTYDDFRYEKAGKDADNNAIVIVEDYSGNAVAGVAPTVFNAGIDAETKVGLYGNINFNYRGKMSFTSDGLNEADAYSLLNAKIGFRKAIQKFTLNVYAGTNNITGTQYYYMVFVNQLPDAYIPAPNEMNFFGGLGLKYNF